MICQTEGSSLEFCTPLKDLKHETTPTKSVWAQLGWSVRG